MSSNLTGGSDDSSDNIGQGGQISDDGREEVARSSSPTEMMEGSPASSIIDCPFEGVSFVDKHPYVSGPESLCTIDVLMTNCTLRRLAIVRRSPRRGNLVIPPER